MSTPIPPTTDVKPDPRRPYKAYAAAAVAFVGVAETKALIQPFSHSLPVLRRREFGLSRKRRVLKQAGSLHRSSDKGSPVTLGLAGR